MKLSIVLSDWQVLMEVVGTLAFFGSGIIQAARNRLDVVGFYAVAGLTAFGGGTLRDVLLDRRPFFWVEHANWLWALMVITLAAMRWMRARHFEPTERAMVWPDAVGLAVFAAGGAQIAIQSGMSGIVAALLGTVTAVCGGVLRDIVCNQVPSAFSDHRPYAVLAFLGGWVVVGAHAMGAAPDLSLVVGALATLLMRLAAVWLDVQLPAWSPDTQEPGAKKPREP